MFDSKDLLRSGKNFLVILNDIERRPEDAARDLQVPIEEINDIISGKKELNSSIIRKLIMALKLTFQSFYSKFQ